MQLIKIGLVINMNIHCSLQQAACTALLKMCCFHQAYVHLASEKRCMRMIPDMISFPNRGPKLRHQTTTTEASMITPCK
jgi:hypothetical protein